MADTAVTVYKMTRAGVTAAYTTAVVLGTTNYAMKNDGRTFLRVYKTGANACTMTLLSVQQVRGLAVAQPTVTIPATTGDLFIGPFEASIFNDAAGVMRFNFSEVTGLFFMAVAM